MNLSTRNVVLLVTAGVLAVPTILQLRRDADTFVDVGAVPAMFDGFTADNVMVITLAQPKKEQPPAEPNNPQQPKVAYDQLVLQRTDKGWALGAGDLAGAPVVKDRVENDVFQHLRSIRSDRDVLVQPNATPEQLAKYGLDEAHAFVVRATDATPLRPTVLAELLVGNDSGAGQTGTEAVRGVFVRKSDSTDVVLYEFERGWRRDVAQEQWLDKVIAKLEPDKIQKLSIKNAATAGVTFTFEREPGKQVWRAVDPPAGLGAVRQAEVDGITQRLRWIGVQDYRWPRNRIPNPTALGLTPPQIEIEFTVKEGDRDRVLKLEIGNKLDDKNEYYFICNESTFVMTWPAGMVTPFEVDVKSQMFDPAAPPPEQGKPEQGKPEQGHPEQGTVEPPKNEQPKKEEPPKKDGK